MLARAGEVGRAGPAIRWLGGIGAVIPLLALVLVLVVLVIEAMGAIRLNGLHFFTATEWNPGNTYGETVVTDGVAHPVGAYYGALPLIVGTLATSAIALIIAVPVSVGAALVIVERLPKRLAEAVGAFPTSPRPPSPRWPRCRRRIGKRLRHSGYQPAGRCARSC